MLHHNLLIRIWRTVKTLYVFLLPIRFSLLAVLITGWAFCLSDQGADILRSLVEYDPCKNVQPHYWRMLLFVVATNALALQSWYWARQILRVKPPQRTDEDDYFTYPPSAERFPFATVWTPRALGVLTYLLTFAAFLNNGHGYFEDVPNAVDWMLGWLIASLILFLVFVVIRRRFLDRKGSSLTQRDPSDFSLATKVVLAITILAELVFFVWSTLAPVSLAPLGSGSLLLITAALWVPVGTVLVYVGMQIRFPVLSVLLIWASLWSCFADRNHVIRTMAVNDMKSVSNRPDAEQRLEAWYARVAPGHAAGEAVPIFVVATEGGGIRAAYWTASALTAAQDRYPGFADHLFAISSVSGGSLGAAVFDALIAHGPAPADSYEHACDGKSATQVDEERKTLRYAAKQVLSFDFLTPALAGMTQPDLAQRFLPFGFPDRERALELAWERGWSRTMHGDTMFAHGMLATIQSNDRLPSLFINGTLVETGDRVVTSNCRIHPPDLSEGNRLGEFRNAYDSFTGLDTDIPFSAAAGMSARFTYMSPAGRLPWPDGRGGQKTMGHVVDGGYFENSGAATASEVLTLIKRVSTRRGWNLRPIIIFIDFHDDSLQCRKDPAHCRPDPAVAPFTLIPTNLGPLLPPAPQEWGSEVLSSLRALLSTREGRGSQAVSDARFLLTPISPTLPSIDVLEFRLVQRRVPLPLGWILSEQSRMAIDQAISPEGEGGNTYTMQQIGAALGADAMLARQPDPVSQSAKASVHELKKTQ